MNAPSGQIALGQMRNILLPNLLFIEKAAVLFQARVRLDPRRWFSRVVVNGGSEDSAKERRIHNDAVVDFSGFFVQASCQRRFRLHARCSDRDGQSLPPCEAAVGQHVPVLRVAYESSSGEQLQSVLP
jgi:hypothetical protein